jgi:hypothetical protein
MTEERIKMVAENQPSNDSTEPDVEDDLGFVDPKDFPSYDEVESDEGQGELPDDSYDESAATDDEDGCGVHTE